MTDRDETRNLGTTERIIRVILGIAIFAFGLEVSNIVSLKESSSVANGSFLFILASFIDRFRNVVREIAWFLGFVLFFTGSTGFCPIYKLVQRSRSKK
ncbi:MAG: YgaP family membrane protein [Caldisericaceae bacterium]